MNGFVREALLIPRIGEVSGRAISTLALSLFIVILTWISIAWIAPRSTQQAWAAGLWVVLTFYQMVGMAPSVLMRGDFIEIASPFSALPGGRRCHPASISAAGRIAAALIRFRRHLPKVDTMCRLISGVVHVTQEATDAARRLRRADPADRPVWLQRKLRARLDVQGLRPY